MSELRILRHDDDYDFEVDVNSIYNHFQNLGKNYINEKFKLQKKDADVVHAILGYMHFDELLDSYKLTRSKGLFVVGPAGCGKTAFMRILKSSMKDREFTIVSATHIVNQYMVEGPQILQNYINNYPILCIDDFGVEKDGMYFGNVMNVVYFILKGRCERSQFKGNCITHVTTKIPMDKLIDRYDLDIISIMSSLFNLVAFESETNDKRKMGL
jgi:hypothetical protein